MRFINLILSFIFIKNAVNKLFNFYVAFIQSCLGSELLEKYDFTF